MKFRNVCVASLIAVVGAAGIKTVASSFDSPGNTALWVFDSSGLAITNSHLLPAVPPEWRVEGYCDLNADGIADVVLRNATTGSYATWILAANGDVINSAVIAASVNPGWSIKGCAPASGSVPASLVLHFD